MNWFESVPNFSEGRDASKLERIVSAGRTVPGVTVLDVELNADHNRSVVSLVGSGPALVEALTRMARVAVAEIDLTHHTGEHPRMGAVDVVPFVPLGASTVSEATQLAEELARRLWTELKLPVYLYADSARRPERRDLANVRKGQFEGIRDSIATDPDRAPDVGDAQVHPTAGIVAVGARPVLIAYNAYLTTPDVGVAKKVAHAVRGRDGGLAEVKALGFDIKERQRAQVSMNLTDFHRTPLHRALELTRREARRYGADVEESEIVGLVPEDALLDAAEFYLQLNRFDRAAILERKVRAAESGTAGTGATSRPLRDLSVSEFAARLAARTPTPGGGSAAAATAAFGAALGEMAVSYSQPKEGADAGLTEVGNLLAGARASFLVLVDDDAASYEAVRSTRRAWKSSPESTAAKAAYAHASQRATEVPLETARRAAEVERRLEGVSLRVKPTVASDLTCALALLRSARESALANVEINLADLSSVGGSTAELVAEVARLRSRP